MSASPATILINLAVVATMDDEGREFSPGAIRFRDGWIEAVGSLRDAFPKEPERARVIDLSGHALLPGLVNTHHHLYQTLTRAVPAVQDVPLFDWLRGLYPLWARLDSEAVHTATMTGLAELALSGCTTAADHQYLFPNDSAIDDQFRAAEQVGIRFHASRGSMSLGESDGGLPPDSVVESEEAILEDCERAAALFHDPEPGAMRRVTIAPCSPFSVTPDLMRESAGLARRLGLRLHTHLAETKDEEEFCRERFGARPVEYAEDLGWAGEDVWFAHAVHTSPGEAERMGRAGTGVAHCPTSNMRLASGIAPVARYQAAGVPVGLGVDGSASNDSGHLLAEVRSAMLLGRLATAPGVGSGEMPTARGALRMATRGGARALGRDDIGSLEAGKAADMIAVSLDRIEYAGALHDPVAALVMCSPAAVDFSWVHGRPVVKHGRLTGVDQEELTARHNRLARRLVQGGD